MEYEVRDFYNKYGIREWNRLDIKSLQWLIMENSCLPEVLRINSVK